MMPRKIVKKMYELTQGKPLTAEDVGGVNICVPLPTDSCILDIPGDISLYDGKSTPKRQREIKIPFGFNILAPEIKGYQVDELSSKWVLPYAYAMVALKGPYLHDDKYKVGGYDYQQAVKMYAKALNIYKELVNELLELVVPEDREVVKCRVLSDVFYDCILDLDSSLRSKLQHDITRCIKQYGITNIPQNILDMWIEVTSIEVAMKTEGYQYILNRNKHEFDAYRKENKYWWARKDYFQKYSFAEFSFTHTHSNKINDLIKQRQLTLNPPTTIGEKITVKVHPAMMMFSQQLQKVTNFVSNAVIGSGASDDEKMALLDKLEEYYEPTYMSSDYAEDNQMNSDDNSELAKLKKNYKPAYIAPHDAKNNQVDGEIKWLEKKIIIEKIKLLDAKNINGLLDIAQEGLKLLSLIHMRYSASLNDKNDYSYFGLTKTNTAIDKENYYKIFAFYMENIFNETLVTLFDLTKNNNDYGNIAAQATNILQNLESYYQDLNNQEDTNVHNSTKTLREIQRKFGIEEIITRTENLYSDAGLHCRIGRKIILT